MGTYSWKSRGDPCQAPLLGALIVLIDSDEKEVAYLDLSKIRPMPEKKFLSIQFRFDYKFYKPDVNPMMLKSPVAGREKSRAGSDDCVFSF